VSINTDLVFDIILVEDTPQTRAQRDGYAQGFGFIALPITSAGKAYGQMAQLKNVPLGNYMFDQEEANNQTIPGLFQFVVYQAFNWETSLTCSIDFPPGIAAVEQVDSTTVAATHDALCCKLDEEGVSQRTFAGYRI
jgi:hypothetical protein